jgi:hypothetical protein
MFSIRSQMLYPVSYGCPRRTANLRRKSAAIKCCQKKSKNFPAVRKIRNDLLTQGYGVDHAKSSTLRFTRLHRQALRAGIYRSGVLRPFITHQ